MLYDHHHRTSPGSARLLCPSHLVPAAASEISVTVLNTVRIFQRDYLSSPTKHLAEPGVNPGMLVSETHGQACLALSHLWFFPLLHPLLLSRGDPAASR